MTSSKPLDDDEKGVRIESADPRLEFALKSAILQEAARATYCPHPQFNLFGLVDATGGRIPEPLLRQRLELLWAAIRVLQPDTVAELGVLCGISADAMLDAHPGTAFLGIDYFREPFLVLARRTFVLGNAWGLPWDNAAWARLLLLATRRYPSVSFLIEDLEKVEQLPACSLVHVDAGREYCQRRRDLELAMTAAPQYVLVSGLDDGRGPIAAFDGFVRKYADFIQAVVPFECIGGLVLVALQTVDRAVIDRSTALERSRWRDTTGWWRYHRLGFDARLLEFRENGAIGIGAEEQERTWHLDIMRGCPIITLAGLSGPTCRLGRLHSGLYRGRWLGHERMPVELYRALPQEQRDREAASATDTAPEQSELPR
jgi:hypothetical protein